MIKRIQPGTRLSGAVVHGDTVYVSGQVPDDTSEGVPGQTRQVLAKIDALLAEAGTDKSKVLWANVWLSDIATFNEMNKVWDGWLAPGCAPARATVEANLATPQIRVEIACVAAVG
jgi:enamine deaminase RidA (YjgF/YER057c/UK114 family)